MSDTVYWSLSRFFQNAGISWWLEHGRGLSGTDCNETCQLSGHVLLQRRSELYSRYEWQNEHAHREMSESLSPSCFLLGDHRGCHEPILHDAQGYMVCHVFLFLSGVFGLTFISLVELLFHCFTYRPALDPCQRSGSHRSLCLSSFLSSLPDLGIVPRILLKTPEVCEYS